MAVLTISQWLSLAEKRSIRCCIAHDHYSMAYPTLRRHFDGIREISWESAVVGLHVVYGWMPTIPKLDGIMRWCPDRQQQLVDILKRARAGDELGTNDVETIKSFCNNSMVGASKLLHFLNTDCYPIWDSKVARTFFRKKVVYPGQINTLKNWNQYRADLAGWLDDGRVKDTCKQLRRLAGFLCDVSNLRLVELVMFHKQAPKNGQRQSPGKL